MGKDKKVILDTASSKEQEVSITSKQSIFLLIFSLSLAILIFAFKGGLSSQKPLDLLARRSIDPGIALLNHRPTVFEFYADWCEVCKEMAPELLELDNNYSSKVDFVLLNVDNPAWSDLIEKYQVNGVPQLNFFNTNGELVGKSIGLRTKNEISLNIEAIIHDDLLEESSSLIDSSNLTPIISKRPNYSDRPRSHG